MLQRTNVAVSICYLWQCCVAPFRCYNFDGLFLLVLESDLCTSCPWCVCVCVCVCVCSFMIHFGASNTGLTCYQGPSFRLSPAQMLQFWLSNSVEEEVCVCMCLCACVCACVCGTRQTHDGILSSVHWMFVCCLCVVVFSCCVCGPQLCFAAASVSVGNCLACVHAPIAVCCCDWCLHLALAFCAFILFL